MGTVPAPSGPFVHREDLPTGRHGRRTHVAWSSVDAGNLGFHVLAPEDRVGRAGVAASRHRLEDAMGVPHGSTLYLEQVHGVDVVTAAPGALREDAAPPVADAAVSPDGSRPLAVMVADCLPVVLVDDRTGAIAMAHAGRRGLLDGVLEATVDALAALRPTGQSQAFGMKAWIGPAVCGRCYEVPAGMRDEAVARIPETASSTSWGTPALDLPAGAQAVLRARGVAVERIRACTLEDPRVFSHRREPGRGRFAGLVWTSPNETAEAGAR